MIKKKLDVFLNKRRCTLLGIGPMSVNCVDAAIELANIHEIPLFLIASRRQVDSELFGGGYVNNWTTEQFSRYVIDHDKKGKIILSRDHGGPWQNLLEVSSNMSLRHAMLSAKTSFLSDIKSGFQVLHIDPSIDIHGNPNIDEVLERVFELYEFCYIKSQEFGSEVIFEIGTEEQSGSTNSQEELEYTLSSIKKFCDVNKIPFPTFVVIQCGTRVMETRNVGSFDSPIRVADELPSEILLPKMIEICNNYGIFMKEHNTDYISDAALHWHPRLGIHAANVAPEFGVTETRAFIEILRKYNLEKILDKFLTLAFESKKWEKWMIDRSTANNYERAVIAGHYVFSTPECTELKNEAQSILMRNGVMLDLYLKNEIIKSINRYLINFRLINSV